MKTAKNKIGIALLVIAAVILLGGCATVVKPGYLGIKNHPLGKGLATAKIYDNGIVWKKPWDGVKKYNVQWQTFPEMVAILSQDELHTTITISATLRPKVDELGQLALEVGEGYYEKVVKPAFFAVTRSTFAKYKYMELSRSEE